MNGPNMAGKASASAIISFGVILRLNFSLNRIGERFHSDIKGREEGSNMTDRASKGCIESAVKGRYMLIITVDMDQ